MIPARSTFEPTMNPETSARYTRGTLYALQSQMNRAALSEESTKRTPPLTLGWFATIPTARPPRRAKPVMISRAKRAFISSHEPASTSPRMTSCMSKYFRWS